MTMLAHLLTAVLLVTPGSTRDWLAPTEYEHVVPRLGGKTKRVFTNLRYEGNNRSLRSTLDPTEPPCAVAQRTAALADRTAGLFVLRDALFSQQDHPVQQRPCALMMPPNWVSVAVDAAMRGHTPAGVQAPALLDDAAWTAISTPAALFGDFVASDTLHGWATRPRQGASDEDLRRIDNARHSVHGLAADAQRLREAIATGPQAVARVGAEIIAASDRAYFGDRIRHNRVIPMFVENPSEHEIVDENKGLVAHGRDLDPEAIRMTREHVYGRRLQDGPMAVERYDITREQDVQRAIAVLEQLVPRGTRGHRVHVWVGGPLLPGTERVADVHERLPAFVARLSEANVEPSRVTVFARPVFQARGHTGADLQAGATRARDQGVLYGVNMIGAALRSMMSWH